MLPEQAINEFIQMYFEDTGIKLSTEEATILATRFFDGMRLILTTKDIVDPKTN